MQPQPQVQEHLVQILQHYDILPLNGKMVKPCLAVILEDSTPAQKLCSSALQRLCREVGKLVVSLPPHVVRLLKDYKAIKTIDWLQACECTVLKNATVVNQVERMDILLALLHWVITCHPTRMAEVKQKLHGIPWIPTLGGKLLELRKVFSFWMLLRSPLPFCVHVVWMIYV